MNYIEIIGYVASILIAVSLTMSNILKLRVINLIGSVTFSTYGFLLEAYPVFVVNAFIVLINIYYLYKMIQNKDEFDVLDATNYKEYSERFYLHYKDDILKFFPNFTDDYIEKCKAIFILRNMRPVNLVVFNKQENNITEIILDYAIPEYRDFLNGKYLLSLFKDSEANEKQLVVKTVSKDHIKYLSKLGFIKNDAGLYVKKI